MTTYTDLDGRTFDLGEFDAEERSLLTRFKRLAGKLEAAEYQNKSLAAVAELYESRGLSRKQIIRQPLYAVLQDLGARRMVEQGEARLPDYRDQIEELIRTRFATRRAFCKATGLSEDMLSHVLSRRKNLSVESLNDALERIGYGIQIRPLAKSG